MVIEAGALVAIQGDCDRAFAGGRGRRHDSSQLVNRGVDHGDVDLGACYHDLDGGAGQSQSQGGIGDGDGGVPVAKPRPCRLNILPWAVP
jgi:hypothetical protein